MDQINDKKISKAYTCISCNAGFENAADQRQHHQTDWHRYNLKRKVANLPPVEVAEFARRVNASRPVAEVEPERGARAEKLRCDNCHKEFASKNTLDSHLSSKKHKDSLLKQQQQLDANAVTTEEQVDEAVVTEGEEDEDADGWEDIGVPVELLRDSQLSRSIQKRLKGATTEEEMIAILQDKIKGAIRMDPKKNCLFCPHLSSDLETNIQHMTEVHRFFIPDIDYLINLEGLIAHLGEKISVKNTCLYCNGRGKAFNSLEAVWGHMLSKEHQKIAYDQEEDEIELEDFYDFSSTWIQLGGEDQDMTLVSAGEHKQVVHLSEDQTELTLPSGVKIGHRSMQRYYKQRFPSSEERESLVLARTAERYRQLAALEQNRFAIAQAIKARQPQIRAVNKNTMLVNLRANSQKHFRDAIL